MPGQIREFHRAANPARAVELLQRTEVPTGALVIGPRPPDSPFAGAEALVDLGGLALDYIRLDGDRLQIGALTPLQALVESPAVNALAGGILAQAAQLAAHFGLRNLATVAGALADGDGPPEVLLALLALDAQVLVAGKGEQRIALAAYQPAPADLVLEVTVPRPVAGLGGALARVARTPLDQAIVVAVATATDTKLCVAVAGAGAQPMRLEATVAGASMTDRIASLAELAAANAAPVADYRGSAEYRKAMAGVLAQRALRNAFKNRMAA